jgi:hypothetical protein
LICLIYKTKNPRSGTSQIKKQILDFLILLEVEVEEEVEVGEGVEEVEKRVEEAE